MSGLIDPRLAAWFAGDDTGISSKAIALYLGAGVKDETWGAGTPSDPSDLGRCLRLLERIPEFKQRLPEMAEAGGNWPTLLKHWDKIVASFVEEAGGRIPGPREHWKAPKTYALMKAAEEEAWSKRAAAERPIDLGGGLSVRSSA